MAPKARLETGFKGASGPSLENMLKSACIYLLHHVNHTPSSNKGVASIKQGTGKRIHRKTMKSLQPPCWCASQSRSGPVLNALITSMWLAAVARRTRSLPQRSRMLRAPKKRRVPGVDHFLSGKDHSILVPENGLQCFPGALQLFVHAR